MKIYTKTGDDGNTSLVDGTRVPKHNLRVDAYGELDELNSSIGFALCELRRWIESKSNAAEADLRTEISLLRIQSLLFTIGSCLACSDPKVLQRLDKISSEDSVFIEKEIDLINSHLPPLTNFILPGGSEAAARLHLCRTICRRAERRISLAHQESNAFVNELIFINRLSDYLFVAARYFNQTMGFKDVLWKGGSNS